ncbi:MAG: PKD domain-containing protein, partial [Thermoplasmata archaeon]|nr:PKD domain-containing protein [Thermoplasmata archaeon]
MEPSRRLVHGAFTAAFAILLVLILTAPGPGPLELQGTNAVHPPPSHAAGFPTSAAGQLSLARASLSSRLGPASLHPAATPAYALASWTNLTTTVASGPSGRLTVMTWDATDGYVLLFGGESASGILSDSWTYLNGTWTNITASTVGSPPGLFAGGMAFDPSSGNVILFGGENHTFKNQKQTWSYHSKHWTNLTSSLGSSPSARAFPAMATDSTDAQIVLYGGQSTSGFVRDTWVYKNVAWTNETSAAPVGALVPYALASDDPPDHGVLMFGPLVYNGSQVHLGTYLFTGGIWRNLTSTLVIQPSPIALGQTAYLPAAAGVFAVGEVLFNRTGGTVLSQITWEFAGGAWKNLTGATGQQPRVGLAGGVAADPWDSTLIAFGGENLGGGGPLVNSYTWVLSAAPAVTASVSPHNVIDAGMAVTFTGTVANGIAPNIPAWTFGDGGTAATLSGSHTYSGTGLFTATLTVTSFSGSVGAALVSVYVNPALAVSGVTPTNATQGTSAAFGATVAGGTGPFAYAWGFGDGSSASTASNPSHTYGSAGTYTVTVKVTDSLGSFVNVTSKVTVASKPSTAVELGSGTGLGLIAVIVVL